MRKWLWQWQSHSDNHVDIVDLLHFADMDESYGTYVDEGYFENHDYTDDETDDGTAYDTDDDTGDDNDHKTDSYTAAGAAPTQTRLDSGEQKK